jgi:hypothetical protein
MLPRPHKLNYSGWAWHWLIAFISHLIFDDCRAVLNFISLHFAWARAAFDYIHLWLTGYEFRRLLIKVKYESSTANIGLIDAAHHDFKHHLLTIISYLRLYFTHAHLFLFRIRDMPLYWATISASRTILLLDCITLIPPRAIYGLPLHTKFYMLIDFYISLLADFYHIL